MEEFFPSLKKLIFLIGFLSPFIDASSHSFKTGSGAGGIHVKSLPLTLTFQEILCFHSMRGPDGREHHHDGVLLHRHGRMALPERRLLPVSFADTNGLIRRSVSQRNRQTPGRHGWHQWMHRRSGNLQRRKVSWTWMHDDMNDMNDDTDDMTWMMTWMTSMNAS